MSQILRATYKLKANVIETFHFPQAVARGELVALRFSEPVGTSGFGGAIVRLTELRVGNFMLWVDGPNRERGISIAELSDIPIRFEINPAIRAWVQLISNEACEGVMLASVLAHREPPPALPPPRYGFGLVPLDR